MYSTCVSSKLCEFIFHRETIPCPHPTKGMKCDREMEDLKANGLFLDQGGRKRRTGLQNKKIKIDKRKKNNKKSKNKRKKKKIKNKKKNSKKKRTSRSSNRNKRIKNKRRRMQRSARNSPRTKTPFCSNKKSLVGLLGKVSWASDRKGKRKVPILAKEECREMLSR